jgi:glycine betaine/choline ABC-type transport system substrate-binding protein
MFRKHTRRAAKAAFAISFGVALLIGLAACGGGGGNDTTTAATTTAAATTKYTALIDNKHIFGFQNVAPVVKKTLITGPNGAALVSTVNGVSSKLTLPAMQAMNKAYVVNKETPKQIAHDFLAANGLLKASTKATSSAPTIVLGTKNFGEEYILGQLYGQALQANGFKVDYKGSFGSSELADTAITSGKMNFYPEYTGIIALDLAKVKNAPQTAAATYAAANNFEQTRGLTLLKPTPFSDTDTFTVLTTTATKDGLKTVSDLSKLKSFSYAGYPECQTRITCILGMKQIYHLKNIKFIPIGNISVYTLLDEGKATGGDGFSTDPQQLQK